MTCASLSLPELARMVMEESGYLARLKESRDEEDAERLENLEQLLAAMEEFCEKTPMPAFPNSLSRFRWSRTWNRGSRANPR